MEVHGRRLGGDQEYPVPVLSSPRISSALLEYPVLSSSIQESTGYSWSPSQASTMHLHSAAREGAAYRRCHFAAETCPYRDHVGSREAGGSAADSAMGGTE